MTGRITLVGYRASGKSTVGRQLAQRLSLPFVDLDNEIIQRIGSPIAEFFAKYGEPAFRAQESAALEIALSASANVLATGGGAVIASANRDQLKKGGGLVVYLCADVPTLQARLRAQPGGRPSLTGASISDEVPKLLAERENWYREVSWLIVDAALSVDSLVNCIIKAS